jgi:hypothetical protein
MMNKDKTKVRNILVKGTFQQKSSLLEEIWEERDVSMVCPLVDVLEMEKSRAVKKQILTVLNRLVMLLGFRDVNVDIDFNRMLRSSDPIVRDGIFEIILNSEIPNYQFIEQRIAMKIKKNVKKA